jgi:hypothetical protein
MRDESGRLDYCTGQGRHGAFGDPGLTEARALVRIPIFGPGEEGLRAAAATADASRSLTLGEAMRAPIAARVRALGLGAQLQNIRVLPMSVGDRIAAATLIGGPSSTQSALVLPAPSRSAARPCGGLGAQMAEETGAAVLDGVEAFVAAAQASSSGLR